MNPKYYLLLILVILVVGFGCSDRYGVERNHNEMRRDFNYWMGVWDERRNKNYVWRLDNVPKMIHHYEAHHPDWTNITNIKPIMIERYNNYIKHKGWSNSHSLESRMSVAIEEGY